FDRRRARMPDMVPDEVEAAEGVGGLAHDAARIPVSGEVGDDPFGPAARLFDFGDGRGATTFIAVGSSHGGTLPGPTKGAAATPPGSRRRHQSDLAFEPHGGPSLQACLMVRSNVSPGFGRIADSAPGNRASASPEPEAGVRKRGRSG